MTIDGTAEPLVTAAPGLTVRPWRESDLDSLIAHANNRNVSRMLRDRFPFPYEAADGRRFLEWAARLSPITVWAIDLDGEAVGGIGLELGKDVERVSAEIGYWVGERCWGRGLATAALARITEEAFARFELSRVFALPFRSNAASIRVLEKAGFVLEGRLRQSAVKDGVIQDQLLYARYR